MNLKSYVTLLACISLPIIACEQKETTVQKIQCYTELATALVTAVVPDPNKETDPTKKAQAEKTQQTAQLALSVAKDSVDIAAAVEEFATKKISDVEKKGDELIKRIQCLQNSSGSQCAALGCTDQKACIALVLKTTKDLILLISDSLIAGQSLAAKDRSATEKKMIYDQGALYKLVSMKLVPDAPRAGGLAGLRTALQTEIASFADKLNAGFAFTDLLAILLAPQAMATATGQAKLANVEPVQTTGEFKAAQISDFDL